MRKRVLAMTAAAALLNKTHTDFEARRTDVDTVSPAATVKSSLSASTRPLPETSSTAY